LNLTLPIFVDGSKVTSIACQEIQELTQMLIDSIDDHAHLTEAKLLVFVESSESNRKNLKLGKRTTIGSASKANSLARMISCMDLHLDRTPDFVIRLNGDWLDLIGYTEAGGAKVISSDPKILSSVKALIDHELCHCFYIIAGEFVDRGAVFAFVKFLGSRHIKTYETIVNDKDQILVQYQAVDKLGKLKFKMKGHDIEEFHNIVSRHGSWSPDIKLLADIITEHSSKFMRNLKKETENIENMSDSTE